MAPQLQELKRPRARVAGGNMAVQPQDPARPHDETDFLSSIEHHRTVALAMPFVVAALLILAYSVGGSHIREVIDFLSPRQLLR